MTAARLGLAAFLIGECAALAGAGLADLLPSLGGGGGAGGAGGAAPLSPAGERRALRLYRRRLAPEELARRRGDEPFARQAWLDRHAACENMLQLLYIARHEFREVEADANFGQRSTSYRVAHATKRLALMGERLLLIHTTLQRHKPDMRDVRPALALHHKAVRVYVDYQQLYWVAVRLDGALSKSRTRFSAEHEGPAGPRHNERPLWQQSGPAKRL